MILFTPFIDGHVKAASAYNLPSRGATGLCKIVDLEYHQILTEINRHHPAKKVS
ncbi:MAG: hypothetical protein ACLFUP_06490 [Desulfobacteraceae bacterium]